MFNECIEEYSDEKSGSHSFGPLNKTLKMWNLWSSQPNAIRNVYMDFWRKAISKVNRLVGKVYGGNLYCGPLFPKKISELYSFWSKQNIAPNVSCECSFNAFLQLQWNSQNLEQKTSDLSKTIRWILQMLCFEFVCVSLSFIRSEIFSSASWKRPFDV